jgi:hypothetical protein
MKLTYAAFLPCALLAACMSAELPSSPVPAGDLTCASPSVAATEAQRPDIRALRQSVERSPLYTAAAGAGVERCAIAWQSEGRTMLDYRFRGGNALQVSRDPAIEWLEQTAHFAQSPARPPLALLADAERAAYGSDGCGIDWNDPESRPAAGTPADTESVYRGAACNCQAIVRHDAAGRVTALTLKSAC